MPNQVGHARAEVGTLAKTAGKLFGVCEGGGMTLLTRLLASAMLLLALTLLAMSIVPYWSKENRYLELFGGQRLFYFQLSGLIAVASAMAWRWKRTPRTGWGLAGLVAVGAFSVNAFEVLPWYVPVSSAEAPVVGEERSRFRLVSFNLRGGDNERHEDVAAFLKGSEADFIFLIETETWWPVILGEVAPAYPHGQKRILADGIILSRYPVLRHRYRASNWHLFSRLAEFVLDVNGQELTVVCAHPAPYFFLGYSGYESRNDTLVNAIGHGSRELGGPLVVAGDLNVDIWSPWYEEMIENSGLRDARRGFGVFPSDWQWAEPPLQRVVGRPIDHCLVSPEIRVDDFRLGPHLGSDHLPVVVDLAF